MKKRLLTIGLFIGLSAWSAMSWAGTTVSSGQTTTKTTSAKIPVFELSAPNLEHIRKEDAIRDRNGEMYRIGVAAYTDITTDNHGVWTTYQDGSRQWQLKIKYAGAEALSFLFKHFELTEGSVFSVTDSEGNSLHKDLRKSDMLEDLQQNVALCFGDEMILTLREPAGIQRSVLRIERIVYNYRSTGNPHALKINESESCEVNVNCSPVGDSWQDEKRGVARIYIVDGSGAGWCTGSLVNNTAQDCKPLFLTALHCGVSTTSSDSNLWRFYFGYEAPTCTNPSSAGTLDDNYITGCVRLANSNDNGGDTGSDFLLVQLGTIANQSTTVATLKSSAFNAYWNGWDANNTTVTSAVGIHHPAGDIKKISTSGSTTSTSWGGSVSNTHWRLSWVSNSNGYGVTEGGSSGSPLFNSAGRQIGTLTGGGSYCTAQSSPDSYGKVSYHWTSNGTASANRLKTYLDPGNTGALVLNGSSNPCTTTTPVAPVANFTGTPTSVASGGTVQFTDASTNSPTSWSWSISPSSGWSYAGGTSATSQNPQVLFTTVGTYSITLTAANSAGSDGETKSSYITVTAAQTCSDTYESNNTLSTAKLISANTTIKPFIGTSTDVDYFKFTNTSANPYIRVTLSGLPADYDLYLYNSSGTLLGSSTNGGTTNDVVIYNTTTVGTYYIRVKGYNSAYSSTACYSLIAATKGSTWTSSAKSGEISSSKTPETMFQVIPNPVSEGKVQIKLTDELQGSFAISLHDASGRVVLQQVVSKEEGDMVVPLEVSGLNAGVYFVYINGESLILMDKLLIAK